MKYRSSHLESCLDFLSSYTYLISPFHLWFSNSFFFPYRWKELKKLFWFQMKWIDRWVKVSRTSSGMCFSICSRFTPISPNLRKYRCVRELLHKPLFFGELLFLAAILVLLPSFQLNSISWDGINFSSLLLPLPQSLHPNQRKSFSKDYRKREDRAMEISNRFICSPQEENLLNFQIGRMKCLENPGPIQCLLWFFS